MRGLIEGGSRQLIEEGIRAHVENRPFNHQLRRSIDMAAVQANIGSMMNDASKSMDEAVARFDENDREAERAPQLTPTTPPGPRSTLRIRRRARLLAGVGQRGLLLRA